MVTIGDYRRVRSVDEILAVFTSSSHPARVLAGGTDLLTRLETDSPDRILVVDIGDVSELAGISSTGSGLRIGAATKLADIENSELLDGLWQVLARSAAQVGSPQIRNLATIGGNICNASPAADTVPPLLVLDAEVELISPRGVRKVPLVDFFVGPGKSILSEDEFLASILLPEPPPGALATYLKHSPRRAMDLAVVGVGVLLARMDGRSEARIALGAVAPIPLRATHAESLLAEARQLNDPVIKQAARLAAQEAKPISDVRASAEYRTAMIEALVGRALRQLAANLP